MTHKTLLEMLESDNIDEQEFNARLWCWFNNFVVENEFDIFGSDQEEWLDTEGKAKYHTLIQAIAHKRGEG